MCRASGRCREVPSGVAHPVLTSVIAALLATALTLTTACSADIGGNVSPAPPAPVIRAAAIEAHMRFLASDLLEGREAGTRGYDLAASYVATQFHLLGLRPAGDAGTFQQAVPLLSHWLVREGTRMTVRTPRGSRNLVFGDDFVVSPSPADTTSRVSSGAVFVGYGIDAPAFKHNDYAGLDVRGKVVVALSGYPVALPGEEGAHHGSSREKLKTAASHGATGFVQIYTERYEKVRPWTRVLSTIDEMSMAWIGPDGRAFEPAAGIDIVASMSPAGGASLFDGATRSYADVRTEAATGAPKGFPLAVSLEIAQASRHERRASANVAAVLEGSDAKLRDEYVVVLGHLDHEGIGTPVNGDRIYNGALDNAAGIAGMLEAARSLASQSVAPRRSVLFLAVTAEEKGLVGSEYFAAHPTVPIGSIVAAVNIDMPVLLYDFTDVIAFGAQHSTIQRALEAALPQAGLTLSPDPMPEQVLFVRSDHYSFVRQGVPSIFLATGWNSPAGVGEGGKVFNGFLAGAYHSPQDDLNQPINFEAGAKFATANALILKSIADADERPRWNDGDFFGSLFGGTR